MDIRELTPDELLGPLNDVEQKNAPAKLFVAGDVNILREGGRVAIVGSRKASPEGVVRAKRLAKHLVSRNIVVVSGLAEGIDTAAHTGTLDAGGRTVAVIGTPLDKVYPRQNTELQDRIMEEQLVVSQFSIGYPTKPANFPQRNRTMALIADATVIMEAADSSGSLHQGWEALRLGRGLYIARSVVENQRLSWPAEMMNYGAQVLSDESLEDFIEALPQRSAALQTDAVPF